MVPENSSNVSGTQQVMLGKLLKFLKKNRMETAGQFWEEQAQRRLSSASTPVLTAARAGQLPGWPLGQRHDGACVCKMAVVKIPPPRGFASTKTHTLQALARLGLPKFAGIQELAGRTTRTALSMRIQ